VILNKFGSLKKSELFKNISVLLSGTILAQILGVVLTPILTRLYSPADFGIYQMFLTTTSVVAALFALRYEVAIVLPNENSEFGQLLGLITKVFSINAIVLLIVLYFFPYILSSSGFSKLVEFRPIVYITVLLLSLQLILSQIFTRKKMFLFAAQSKILFIIVRFIISLIFFVVLKNVWGLLIGFATGHLIVNTFNVYRLFKNDAINIDFNNSFFVLKKYSDFPLNNSLATILNIIIVQIPVIFLAKYFSEELLGQFSLAFRMMMLPVSMINASVSNVFLKKITELKNSGCDVFKFLMKSMVFLSCGLPMFLFVFFKGNWLFGVIFGQNWSMAGRISSILTPYLYLSFITSPLSVVFIIFKRNRVFSMINIFFLVSLIILFKFYNIEDFWVLMKFYSVLNVLYYLVVLFSIFIIARKSNEKN